jgi:(p)ppGpp synthase/HD superfamily hydrolase
MARPNEAASGRFTQPSPCLEELMTAFSQRYEAALILAARAHRLQNRKGSDIPYIVHPVHVSLILLRYGFAEDVVIAGLLHDVVEDQPVPLSEIEAQFGPEVARMVASVTERKQENGRERRWEDRKNEALHELSRAGSETLAIKAADALHNTRILAFDLRRIGPSLWTYFSRGPQGSLWYYRSLAEIVRKGLHAHPLVDELEEAIADLERAIAETEAD